MDALGPEHFDKQTWLPFVTFGWQTYNDSNGLGKGAADKSSSDNNTKPAGAVEFVQGLWQPPSYLMMIFWAPSNLVCH